jgi:hypothetical protein
VLNLYKYSDAEFMNRVNDKIGNVRLFKQHLRKHGLIGNRQQFSEEHVKMFEEIREYKSVHHTTWEMAFKEGLISYSMGKVVQYPSSSVIAEHNNIEYTLTEILKTLQRIEEKLQ